MTVIEIEALILDRNFVGARQEIRKYLKRSRYSDESRLMGSIYYRWLGDFSSALKLLTKYVDMKKTENIPLVRLKLQMEFARVLTYVGGEQAALKIADRIQSLYPGKTSQQYAYLCLWFEKFKEALPYFDTYAKMRDADLIADDSFDNRDKMLFAAICYANLGHFDVAKKLFERVLRLSSEPNLRLRIHTGLANNYFLKGDYKSALTESMKATSLSENLSKLYPPCTDTTLTQVTTFIFCGRYEEADPILDQLIPTLAMPGLSPYHWLNALRLKGLSDFKSIGTFPKAWIDLLIYPNWDVDRFTKEIREFSKIPETILVKRGSIHTKTKSTHYDLSSDTVTIRRADGREIHQWGMTLVDRAVSTLLCAGDRGVSQYLFYDLLWPGDVSVGESKRRIAQLIQRLRKLGHQINWKHGQITLTNFDQMSCTWSDQKRPTGWNFLEKNPEFLRTDLEKYFNLSKNPALEICSYWLRKKLVKKTDRGRASSYEVITTANHVGRYSDT